MGKLPQPFWAVLLAVLGVVLAFAVLFHHTDHDVSVAVLALASNLVSGALGAFAHAASTKADVTTGNAPVTINQSDPK